MSEERKVFGEVFGRQKKLKTKDLKVVLVTDVMNKTSNSLLRLSFDMKAKKVKNSEVLSICYRLFRSIKEIIEPYKEELSLEGFLDIEKELTSELYKTEKRRIHRHTIHQLINVLTGLVDELKAKHHIEDAMFIL